MSSSPVNNGQPKIQARRARAKKPFKKAQRAGNDTAADELASAFGSLGLGLPQLDPPVSEPGEWVPTSEFRGFKSFGGFTCGGCGNVWVSAHSYNAPGRPEIGLQECKKCDVKSAPQQMWLNSQRKPRPADDDEKEPRKSKGPHQVSLCEVCASLGEDCSQLSQEEIKLRLRVN